MSYLVATSLEEALTYLRDSGGRARVVAGATDLYLKDLPHSLVDLSALPGASVIEEADGLITLGACLTHASAASSILILSRATALAEGCMAIGSPQIRNIATLGGNVVNAAPAADAAVALVALGASAVLVDTGGRSREEAVEDLYVIFNRSAVDSTSEILLKLTIKSCGTGEGSAFTRFAPRRALSLPLVNAAARVRIENGCFREVRLVVAPVKPAPTRLLQTEAMLEGMAPCEETWRLVARAASEEVEVRSSLLRCSARYRNHLVGVLAARVLQAASERAREEEGVDGR